MPTPGTGTGSPGPPQLSGSVWGPGRGAGITGTANTAGVKVLGNGADGARDGDRNQGRGQGQGLASGTAPLQGDVARNLLSQRDVPGGTVGAHVSVHCHGCAAARAVTRAGHKRCTRGRDCGTAQGLGPARTTPRTNPPPQNPACAVGATGSMARPQSPALPRSPVGKLRHGTAWRRG